MSEDGGRTALARPAVVSHRHDLAWWPLLAVVALGLAVVYGPVLRDLIQVWTDVPYYSYGFLIAPWSAWLIFGSRSGVTALPWRRDPLGLGVAVVGLGILAAGSALDSLTLAALSLPLVLGGLGRFVLGREAFRPLVFPVAFLGLMAPLPAAMVPVMSWYLQRLAAWFTALTLEGLGIPFWREDVFIHLRTATVHISEACNGLRFLLAMVVVGVAFGWAAGRAPLGRLLVVGLALVAAVAGNVVRVASTTVLVHYWGPAASQGLFHNLFGKAIYLLILGGFVLFVWRFRAPASPPKGADFA